jgi:hypothetical protein
MTVLATNSLVATVGFIGLKSEFGFADFPTAVAPVFYNHFKKLACSEHMFAS